MEWGLVTFEANTQQDNSKILWLLLILHFIFMKKMIFLNMSKIVEFWQKKLKEIRG
jgi:hypothetical protein